MWKDKNNAYPLFVCSPSKREKKAKKCFLSEKSLATKKNKKRRNKNP